MQEADEQADRRKGRLAMADVKDLQPNVTDVALIFEGGGMRASYTSGVVTTLLENDLHFGAVYGVSAGASHTVNYLSRDVARNKRSFVDQVLDPEFGGWKSMLQGRGYFNAHHLYEGQIDEATGPEDPMWFDWDTFVANPAELHIEALDQDTGQTVAWTRKDMPTPHDIGIRVRASSSMPLFMPPTVVDGRTYVDGGAGSNHGILLRAAQADGFQRFFIVRTQPRAYRKKPMSSAAARMMRAAFREHPLVAERTIDRWSHYNQLCDVIEDLEREGSAYVFYPDIMEVDNKTTDVEALETSYERGLNQARRELNAWERWLQTGRV